MLGCLRIRDIPCKVCNTLIALDSPKHYGAAISPLFSTSTFALDALNVEFRTADFARCLESLRAVNLAP
jgi:hypothetical protein